MTSQNALQIIVNRNLPYEVKSALYERNMQVYYSCEAKSLNTALASHPDIQIHFLNNRLAICAPEVYTYYSEILPSYINLQKGDRELNDTYPQDCAYNIARLGNYAIGNLKYMSPLAKELYYSMGVNLIHVNQGYAKCNICIVSDCAMITEDKGIYAQMTEIKEIDCLYLNPGEVLLKGFSHGFVGGASGSVEKCLYFCGSLKHFSQRDKLFAFFKKHHIEFIELCDTPLQDYGSLIFF